MFNNFMVINTMCYSPPLTIMVFFSTVPALVPAVPAAPRPAVTSMIPCKFKGWCENEACEYKHPIPCRYGKNCANPTCTFLHRSAPASARPDLSRYTWVNSNSNPSNSAA